jgi:8-oxo-dGTP pyrophosphatase MutT (NUDIX family)
LRPVCSACGRVVYTHLRIGAGVLIEREGALLLLQRGPDADAFPGAWNLPSGYCEADEPPPLAAAREAAEETGTISTMMRAAPACCWSMTLW